MKVKDLIKELQECDQEAEVIMSCDAEGNDFSLYTDLTLGYYGGSGRDIEVLYGYGFDMDKYMEEEYDIEGKGNKCVIMFRQ